MDVKVALVDSGINICSKNIVSNMEVVENHVIKNCNKNDSNGHGTLCSSAIIATNPKVQILGLKVLDDSNRCSTNDLLTALEYLTEVNVDIINLSLATSNIEYKDRYKKIIDHLKKQNKLVIASCANNNSVSLPAILPNAIGVRGTMFINSEEFWYNKSQEIQCVADSKPVLLKNHNCDYEFFGGNSKATAIFTGIVSNYFRKMKINSLEKLEDIFTYDSKRKQWSQIENEIADEIADIPQVTRDIKILNELEDIVAKTFDISKKNRDLLYDFKLYLSRYNVFNLVQEIEKRFNLDIVYSEVNYYWFYSLNHLYDNVLREIKKRGY